jgi:hypothetical protein
MHVEGQGHRLCSCSPGPGLLGVKITDDLLLFDLRCLIVLDNLIDSNDFKKNLNDFIYSNDSKNQLVRLEQITLGQACET